jgi:hypothetical protein
MTTVRPILEVTRFADLQHGDFFIYEHASGRSVAQKVSLQRRHEIHNRARFPAGFSFTGSAHLRLDQLAQRLLVAVAEDEGIEVPLAALDDDLGEFSPAQKRL